MTPGEIRKKIRQIENQGKRFCTSADRGVSSQSPAEFCGVLISLPEGYYFHNVSLFQNREINRIWPPDNLGFASRRSGFGKTKWVGNNLPQTGINNHGKTSANASLPCLIPITCLAHFVADFGLNEQAEAHCFTLYREYNSALIVSQDMPRSGCARASAARRSSSAICSGERSSSCSINSRSICSTTSRRSSGGNLRICSSISVALIPPVYRLLGRNQAVIGELPPRHSGLDPT